MSSNDWRNKLVKLSGDVGAAITLKVGGGTTFGVTLIFAALAGIEVRPTTISFVACLRLTPRILSLGGVYHAGQYSKLSIHIIQYSGRFPSLALDVFAGVKSI